MDVILEPWPTARATRRLMNFSITTARSLVRHEHLLRCRYQGNARLLLESVLEELHLPVQRLDGVVLGHELRLVRLLACTIQCGQPCVRQPPPPSGGEAV